MRVAESALPSTLDRLDDVRRQQGQSQGTTHIELIDVLGGGNFRDRRVGAALQHFIRLTMALSVRRQYVMLASAPSVIVMDLWGNGSVDEHSDLAALDKLKTRIQALRAKTIDNGCTEAEALLAAAKVAELLDRYDLSLTDVEIRDAPCERREYETHRKKRIPLDDCIGAIANFCDCRVWREKNQAGEARYVFFGLRSDIEVAHYLTELIDNAVRSELGRYKTSAGYRRFRHQDRHMANSSFTLGMVASIADKLTAMKAERDAVNNGTGRDLVVLKASVVDAELGEARSEAADGPPRNADGIADGLRSRRGRRRVIGDQPRNRGGAEDPNRPKK